MTISQILLVTFLYAVALIAAVYFTRPTWRRVAGALIGGAVVGVFGIAAVVLGGTSLLGGRGNADHPAPFFLRNFLISHVFRELTRGPPKTDFFHSPDH